MTNHGVLWCLTYKIRTHGIDEHDLRQDGNGHRSCSIGHDYVFTAMWSLGDSIS